MKSIPYNETYNYDIFQSRHTIEYGLTFQFIDHHDIDYRFPKMKMVKSQICQLHHIYLVEITDDHSVNHNFSRAPISLNMKGITTICYKDIPHINQLDIENTSPVLTITIKNNCIKIHNNIGNDISRISLKCYYKVDKSFENEFSELFEIVSNDWKKFYSPYRNKSTKS